MAAALHCFNNQQLAEIILQINLCDNTTSLSLSLSPVAVGSRHLSGSLHVRCQIFSEILVVIIYTASLDILLKGKPASGVDVSQNMYLLQGEET